MDGWLNGWLNGWQLRGDNEALKMPLGGCKDEGDRRAELSVTSVTSMQNATLGINQPERPGRRRRRRRRETAPPNQLMNENEHDSTDAECRSCSWGVSPLLLVFSSLFLLFWQSAFLFASIHSDFIPISFRFHSDFILNIRPKRV